MRATISTRALLRVPNVHAEECFRIDGFEQFRLSRSRAIVHSGIASRTTRSSPLRKHSVCTQGDAQFRSSNDGTKKSLVDGVSLERGVGCGGDGGIRTLDTPLQTY